jgi:hypothetical protein
MKKFIAIAIFLIGSPTTSQLAIADNYSRFFSNDITVGSVERINDGIRENCGLENTLFTTVIGCHNSYPNGLKTVQVLNRLDDRDFEMVLLHELGHYYFGSSEERADSFAMSLINYYNSVK